MTHVLKNPRETLAQVALELRASQRGKLSTGMGFDMQNACSVCDSVACIGGHAWLIENPGDFEGASHYIASLSWNDDLYTLYYPHVTCGMSKVTRRQAAQAIEVYLRDGVDVELSITDRNAALWGEVPGLTPSVH